MTKALEAAARAIAGLEYDQIGDVDQAEISREDYIELSYEVDLERAQAAVLAFLENADAEDVAHEIAAHHGRTNQANAALLSLKKQAET